MESVTWQNLEARGMQPVTRYAPVRIVLLGLVKAVFGLIVLGTGALVIWATAGGDMQPTKPGDMPHWWMYVVGAAFAFAGLAVFSGGLGKMVSAFARNCYFVAGPEGIAIRFPKQGWFGRFRVVEYDIRWDQIAQLVRFIHRVNLIPMSVELRIELKSGGRVTVERHYFSDSVKAIQQKLLAVSSVAGR